MKIANLSEISCELGVGETGGRMAAFSPPLPDGRIEFKFIRNMRMSPVSSPMEVRQR